MTCGLSAFAGTQPGYAGILKRALCLPGLADAAAQPPECAIEFESSDARLVDGFHWAKAQALEYVRNSGAVGRWYEAALPGRNAFCMRDVSHMSTGAQFLGLGSRTKNMLRHFAEHISASQKYCTWWEITGDDRPAPVDYRNDHDFWYDLPASFDVIDACYRQWLWSGDEAYTKDDVFLNYYRQTLTSYIQTWDHDHDGLPDHPAGYGHMGIATYDEDLQDDVLVGADLVAAQYAACRAGAAFAEARNDQRAAVRFTGQAESLKSLYNNRWWDASSHSFFGAMGEDGKLSGNLKASTGGSDIEFPLYFGLTGEGLRTQASLDRLEGRLHLDEAARTGVIGGVEGVTYLPDIFYQYGRSRAAYTVLVALMSPALKRRTYPEVSFTVIGNLGSGLMGIHPLPQVNMIETFPQLVPATVSATLHHVPVGRNVVSVRHAQAGETALTNEAGPELRWRAAFRGRRVSLWSMVRRCRRMKVYVPEEFLPAGAASR